jgi:murein DD-endopeptidase MepM/ murein hydrolase activator NlpD
MLKYLAEHGDQMADYGWVNAGSWIGNMGGLPNACSTGPHIHFSIDYVNSSYYDGYGQISPWSGYLTKGPDYYWQSPSGWKYYYVRGGSFTLPLTGTVILTQDHHILPRKAIDITTTKGYGAPVYAAMSGNLWKGTDRCGDTYAVIENPSTGIRTAYFHLQ